MLSISPLPYIRLHENPITLLSYNPKQSQASQDRYTSLSFFHCGIDLQKPLSSSFLASGSCYFAFKVVRVCPLIGSNTKMVFHRELCCSSLEQTSANKMRTNSCHMSRLALEECRSSLFEYQN